MDLGPHLDLPHPGARVPAQIAMSARTYRALRLPRRVPDSALDLVGPARPAMALSGRRQGNSISAKTHGDLQRLASATEHTQQTNKQNVGRPAPCLQRCCSSATVRLVRPLPAEALLRCVVVRQPAAAEAAAPPPSSLSVHMQ